MSDPDTRDPVDEVVVQAEAVLKDDQERAARRARVLAAVAAEAQAPRHPVERSRGLRPRWAAAAAAVAVASVAVAVNLPRQGPVQAPPPAPSAPPAASEAVVAGPPPVLSAPPAKTTAASGADDILIPRTAPPETAVPQTVRAAPPPPALAENASADAAAPPPPISQDKAEPLAPTAQATLAPREMIAPAPVAPLARDRQEAKAKSSFSERRAALAGPEGGLSADAGGRLRAAAAAGRTDEVESLLAQGVPVDAPDAEGETALMASVRSDHPATAALLARHGARPDRTNRAGESAKAMAAASADPQLSQALDLKR